MARLFVESFGGTSDSGAGTSDSGQTLSGLAGNPKRPIKIENLPRVHFERCRSAATTGCGIRERRYQKEVHSWQLSDDPYTQTPDYYVIVSDQTLVRWHFARSSSLSWNTLDC